jgi:branched-chain amino acid transport system permease protein
VGPAEVAHPAPLHDIPQLIVSTILLGGIYALIAVGLTLIFGVMRVVNFAHGEFLMLAMYVAFWAFSLLRSDPYLTLVVSLPLFFAAGWLSYRAVMRPVIQASHTVQIFTTVGLSIALQNVALVLWTADARFVRTDYYAAIVRLFGAAFNVAQIVAFAIAVAATAALFAFMRWSYTGKLMRATAQDRDASSLMGIDTDRVYAVTWAVGITCVGVAGVLLAPIYPVYPTAGLQFVLIAYVAVVLGGLGDMAGALIAALLVAAVEVVGSYVLGTSWKEMLYLLLFIGILIVRPAGLFGQRGAEALGT